MIVEQRKKFSLTKFLEVLGYILLYFEHWSNSSYIWVCNKVIIFLHINRFLPFRKLACRCEDFHILFVSTSRICNIECWGGMEYIVLSWISLLFMLLTTQSCPTDKQGICDPVMWILISIFPSIWLWLNF